MVANKGRNTEHHHLLLLPALRAILEGVEVLLGGLLLQLGEQGVVRPGVELAVLVPADVGVDDLRGSAARRAVFGVLGLRGHVWAQTDNMCQYHDIVLKGTEVSQWKC